MVGIYVFHLKKCGHPSLLWQRAVVLNGEDDGVAGGHKGALLDGYQHLSEADLGGEGVAMVDDGEAVVAIPTVQLDTSASWQQNLSVQLHRGLTLQLVPSQICVVAGGDVVVGQGHVHHGLVERVLHQGAVLLVQQVPGETLEAEQMSSHEVRMRFMKLDQFVGVLQHQVLPLVLVQEVEEGIAGDDHVFAGVKSWMRIRIRTVIYNVLSDVQR